METGKTKVSYSRIKKDKMKKIIFIITAIVLTSCSASKKVAKYNEDIKRGIAAYVEDHPCINDTLTISKTDTITETQLQTDTAYQTLNDTVTLTVTKTKKITTILRDTITKTVTDQRLVNYWKDSASNANRTSQALQATNSETKITANDWKHKARLRLYLLIAVAAGSVAWTFRKQLIALV